MTPFSWLGISLSPPLGINMARHTSLRVTIARFYGFRHMLGQSPQVSLSAALIIRSFPRHRIYIDCRRYSQLRKRLKSRRDMRLFEAAIRRV